MAEFDRFADLTASLTPRRVGHRHRLRRLGRPRDGSHVLGSADAQVSPLVFAHQLRHGLPLNKEIDAHHWVDGLNELQIRGTSRTHQFPSGRAASDDRSTGGQRSLRYPPPMRYVPVPIGEPIGWKPVNYLLEVGFTRDTWAHRIDIHAAIGRPMDLDPDHDGRLVADIVGEWADVHGAPFELQLTGPAGGTFSHGVDGEHIEIDALDFIRTLAGRLPGTGVLANPYPLTRSPPLERNRHDHHRNRSQISGSPVRRRRHQRPRSRRSTLVELVAEDFVELVPLPGQGPGRDSLAGALTMMFTAFPDLRWTIDDMLVEDDRVLGVSTWTGTHKGDFMGIPATGRTVTVSAWTVDRYRDSIFVESRMLMDVAGLLTQLGVLPAPASA